MTGGAFWRFMIARTKDVHPAFIDGADPVVEMYDDTVRIADLRGESCTLRHASGTSHPRQLRALATMLQLCADEIERRGFER